MEEITSVDVAELTAVAGAVRETGDGLGRTARGIRSWEFALDASVPGAVTSETAAAEVARCWETTLTTLAGQVREFGADLHRTAERYAETDAFAARRLRDSGHPAAHR